MEQERRSPMSAAGGSPVVTVEQTASTRQKQPFRPTELQEETSPSLHKKRSRAPSVPLVAEELKTLSKDNAQKDEVEREKKEFNRTISSEKRTHIGKTSSSKRQSSIHEEIRMAPMEIETKRAEIVIPPSQPIPSNVQLGQSATVHESAEKTKEIQNSDENDSITGEVAELRTPELARNQKWSNEEEAGGLPRSESRASRISRASRVMRQMFCCGVRHECPSEENISPGSRLSGI